MLEREKVCHMTEELNMGKEKEKQIDLSELHETFEDPNAIKANISIDDVLRFTSSVLANHLYMGLVTVLPFHESRKYSGSRI